MVKKYIPLILILFLIILAYLFDLHHFLSLENLKKHQKDIQDFVAQRFVFALGLFFIVYTAATALSLPVATLLTLMGGFLFGLFWGSFVVVLAATTGACLIFASVKFASQSFLTRAGPWVKKMERGFQENAFSYMLTLRLVPLFPFVVVNIVPGLLGIAFKTYFWSTLLGIMPGSIIYVSLGEGLGAFLEKGSLDIVLAPKFLFTLIGLGVLALLPVLYKRLQKR